MFNPNKLKQKPKDRNQQRGSGSSTCRCLLCTQEIPDPMVPIKPNTESFLSFINILSRGSDNLTTSKNGSLSTNLQFIKNSALILFCFDCHEKLIELNETYAKLEEIRNSLSNLRNEIRTQLLNPNTNVQATESHFFRGFESLRKTLAREVDNDNVDVEIKPIPHLHPEETSIDQDHGIIKNLKTESFEGDDDDSFENEFDGNYSASDWDSGVILPSGGGREADECISTATELLNSSPKPPYRRRKPKRYQSKGAVQNCIVAFGKRIEEIIPFGNETRVEAPEELIHSTSSASLPWTKDRAITEQIYNRKFPAKCPIEECDSEILYAKKDFRQHIVRVHIDKRFPTLEKQRTAKTRIQKEKSLKVGEDPQLQVQPQCHICGKKFATKPNLRIHLMRHDLNSRFMCRASNCGKGFILSYERKNHERAKHWEELKLDPFICKFCNKTFSKEIPLRQHESTHSGTEKFSCDQCEYKTSTLQCIKAHKSTVHGTDCPWVCETCGNSFKLKHLLIKHMLKHKDSEELSLITCDICKKTYNTKRTLRIHKERSHGIESDVIIGSIIQDL